MIVIYVVSLLLLALSAALLGILNYLLQRNWPKTTKAAIGLAGVALVPAAAGLLLYSSAASASS